jgi:hypothetical protein
MTKVTTLVAIDLRLVELATVLLFDAAAGTLVVRLLFGDDGFPLRTREPRLDVRDQQLRLSVLVTASPL